MPLKPGDQIFALENPSGVGTALRAARRKLGLTAREVGATVQMSQSQYSRIEAGQRYCTRQIRQKVEALAKRFQVTVRFTEEDWRTQRVPTPRTHVPAPAPVSPPPIWAALEWAVERKWLTGDQALQLALRMVPTEARA